jgi:hypothetical protein
MAVGLMYTARMPLTSVTNAAQDIWSLRAAATNGLILHWVKITFVPTITSGVAQDVRANIQILERSGAAGTGGSSRTPTGVHPRNTVAALTTVDSLVTSVGTPGDIKWDDSASIIVPYELIFTPDLRIPVSPSTNLSILLVSGLGAAYNATSTICFEETAAESGVLAETRYAAP